MKITGLYIDNVRNLKDFYLNIDKELNILIGPNGVGKTTILEVIDYFISGEYSNPFEDNAKHFAALITKKKIKKSDIDSLRSCYKTKSKELKYLECIRELLKNETKKNIQNPKLPDVGSNCTFISVFYDETYFKNHHYRRGFVFKNGFLYETTAAERNTLFKDASEKYLNFNEHSLADKIVKMAQSQKHIVDKFIKFQETSTRDINNQIDSESKQRFIYSSLPEMKVNVFDDLGRDINLLSSGEKQLQKLKLLLEAKKQIKPKQIIIDEPEVHLNYGRQTYLHELIEKLSDQKTQIFIASHSRQLIREGNYEHLKYIKYDENKAPFQVKLKKTKVRYYMNHPDLFFANGVILVEGYVDEIFFQRTINIILKGNGKKDLSSRNIQIISTQSKDGFKNIVEILKTDLNIKYFIITDFDFIRRKTSYNFVDSQIQNQLKKLIPNNISTEDFSTKIFKNFKGDLPEKFINFLDKIFQRNNKIYDPEIKRYKGFRKIFNITNKKIEDMPNSLRKKIKNLFLLEKIWLLQKGTLDFYVNNNLKSGGKISLEKLRSIYYPNNITDLKTFLTKGTYDEIKKLSYLIDKTFY